MKNIQITYNQNQLTLARALHLVTEFLISKDDKVPVNMAFPEYGYVTIKKDGDTYTISEISKY